MVETFGFCKRVVTFNHYDYKPSLPLGPFCAMIVCFRPLFVFRRTYSQGQKLHLGNAMLRNEGNVFSWEQKSMIYTLEIGHIIESKN